MKQSKLILFTILCFLVFSPILFSQTDKEQITAIRKASNLALKTYDIEEVLSYLTDDALTTTGNGTLLCGKKELESYILSGGKSKMYWIRDTKEIVINIKRGLAWENGNWKGYDPDKSEDPVISGSYSAMWTKTSGTWQIKSQLFVTLNEK
jgi:ketosteroid isomerase-like protein